MLQWILRCICIHFFSFSRSHSHSSHLWRYPNAKGHRLSAADGCTL
jgi:hypothetical protein